MGTKYIIEIPDDKVGDFIGSTHFLMPYMMAGHIGHHDTGLSIEPYTEPNLEQVRKEGYEKGFEDGKELCPVPEVCHNNAYQKGLFDAWEAARKIQDTGGNLKWWIHNTSASEAIEKIRAYEQKKKEEIQVGNEIKGGDEKYIVLQTYLNNIGEPMAILFNRRDGDISVFHLYNGNGAIFEKTGRHFPEIVEVLRKMKEN